ncbi:MAG: glycosyltransferase family 2 protein [Candidatus Omnitrophota bacterium]
MISIIVPVYNEEKSISKTLTDIATEFKDFNEYELIVVNDGSTDNTVKILQELKLKNFSVIDHVENLGYGKALFNGIIAAKYSCIAIIDGDGSYPAESIKELYKYYPQYHMVVGARQGREYNKGMLKRPARILFKHLTEYACGRKIPDVNSGLRIFNKEIVLTFQDSLCTGFSFTTTLTLIFLLNHFYVKYIPIDYFKREGKSKVRHFKDTLRAAQIIIEAFIYYNPLKLFLLIAIFNAISGLFLWILNSYYINSQVINIVSGICVASFVPIFSMGLLAEQLRKIYKNNK